MIKKDCTIHCSIYNSELNVESWMVSEIWKTVLSIPDFKAGFIRSISDMQTVLSEMDVILYLDFEKNTVEKVVLASEPFSEAPEVSEKVLFIYNKEIALPYWSEWKRTIKKLVYINSLYSSLPIVILLILISWCMENCFQNLLYGVLSVLALQFIIIKWSILSCASLSDNFVLRTAFSGKRLFLNRREDPQNFTDKIM